MKCPPWFIDLCAPIDFSNISRFPHENPSVYWRSIPNFGGHDDSVILNILPFTAFILSIGIIHENVVIMFLLIFLKGVQWNGLNILVEDKYHQ
jgi:hypothetical protein